MRAIKSKFWVVTASVGRGVHEEVLRAQPHWQSLASYTWVDPEMLTLLLFIPFYVSQILCIKMCLRSIKVRQVRLVGKVRVSLLPPPLAASGPDSVFPHPCSEVPDMSLMSGSWARLFPSLSLLQCSASCTETERSQRVHPSCSLYREGMVLFEEFLVAWECKSTANSGIS